MRNWLAVGVVFSALTGLAAVVAGCSSSGAPASVQDFCSQLAQAECAGVTSLCTTTNPTACEEAVESQCNTNASTAQASTSEKSGRVFTPTNIAPCINAMSAAFGRLNPNSLTVLSWATLSGTSGTLAPQAGSPIDVCEQVFQGVGQADTNCLTSYDCTNGLVCGADGTCGQESDKTSGEGCGDPGDVCTGDTVCSLQGKLFLCGDGQAPGASCNASSPCGTTSECKNGTCVILSSAGDKCQTNADCSQVAVNGVTDGFCDTSGDKTCTSGYTFGNGAADCTGFTGVSPGNPPSVN